MRHGPSSRTGASRGAPTGPDYRPDDPVDFVVVGAGAAGGIVARELSRTGFRVVVLEQGPYLRESDFSHDEIAVVVRATRVVQVAIVQRQLDDERHEERAPQDRPREHDAGVLGAETDEGSHEDGRHDQQPVDDDE